MGIVAGLRMRDWGFGIERRRGQVDRGLDAPLVQMPDEPVHGAAAIDVGLAVDLHFGMLNAGRQRAGGKYVDLYSLEPDGRDGPGDLFDAVKEGLGIDARAAVRAMRESWGEHDPEGGDVTAPDRGGDLLGGFGNSAAIVHLTAIIAARWSRPSA